MKEVFDENFVEASVYKDQQRAKKKEQLNNEINDKILDLKTDFAHSFRKGQMCIWPFYGDGSLSERKESEILGLAINKLVSSDARLSVETKAVFGYGYIVCYKPD